MRESDYQSPWFELLFRLLDWPVTIPLLVGVLLFVFRVELRAALNRSKIKLTWGDKSIELSELEDNIDQDLDPIKERLDALEAKLGSQEAEGKKEVDNSDGSAQLQEAEKNAVLTALTSKKYRYRTASGIAQDTKIPRAKVIKVLNQSSAVSKAHSRDGRQIYKLKTNASKQK